MKKIHVGKKDLLSLLECPSKDVGKKDLLSLLECPSKDVGKKDLLSLLECPSKDDKAKEGTIIILKVKNKFVVIT